MTWLAYIVAAGVILAGTALIAGRMFAAPPDPPRIEQTDNARRRQQIDHKLNLLASAPQARFWQDDIAALTDAERVFRAVWELEGQVNNGGFDQYFFNSSGRMVPETVNALRAIGANRTAEIVSQAIEAAGVGIVWADDLARQTSTEDLSSEARQRLEALDQEFYSYPDDLTELLYRYLSEHREEIVAPPGFW